MIEVTSPFSNLLNTTKVFSNLLNTTKVEMEQADFIFVDHHYIA